jgi:hypothetical protein
LFAEDAVVLEKSGCSESELIEMPETTINRTIGALGILTALVFGCELVWPAAAGELPPDSFASLAPRPIKEKPSRDYTALPAGGWLFYPSLLAGAVYDDNIFQTPTNKTARLGGQVMPSLIAIRDDGIHKLTLYGTADARLYSGSSDYDSLIGRAGFNHQYEAMRDLVFRFQGDYIRQTDVFNSAATLNNAIGTTNPFAVSPRARPFPYNQFVGSASVVKMFNRSFVSLRGSVSHITYDSSNGVANNPANTITPPDGTIYSVTGRTGYWVSPLFNVYVEPTFNWLQYAGVAGDSTSYRVVSGIATSQIGLYRGEIFAGYQEQRTTQAISSTGLTIGGAVIGGRLTYEPTRFLTLRASLDETLGISQTNDPTAPIGTPTRQTMAVLDAAYTMRQDLIVMVRAGYVNNAYHPTFAGTRADDGWLAGLKWMYNFNRNFGIAFDYQHTELTSNVVNSGYARNVVTLSTTYRY